MPEEKSELDKLFEGLNTDAPKLETEPEKEVEVEEKDEESEGEEPKLNRRERRAIENEGIRRQLQTELHP